MQPSLHLLRVDGRINDHPGTTTQLTVLGDVDKDGMLVFHQRIHDHGSKLQDLVVHVTSAARKSTPVGKDHDWQVLATVEVFQSLCLTRKVGFDAWNPSKSTPAN